MTFLQEAAIVLSCEVSRWTLDNAECYPRVRLWQRAVGELGLPRAQMEADIRARPASIGWACTVTERHLHECGVVLRSRQF